jgi:hypothetical protein
VPASHFTGREFSVELRFRRGEIVTLKNVQRQIHIAYRVSFGGRDDGWLPFGDPLPFADDTHHALHGAFVHDVYHFALAEVTGWSPVVRDGLFGIEGQWKGPDVGMLLEEAIVFNEWRIESEKASLEWCHSTAKQGGANCSHRQIREALDFGKSEWINALKQFRTHGESQHVFGIKMLDNEHRYGSGRLSGVGRDGRTPDL